MSIECGNPCNGIVAEKKPQYEELVTLVASLRAIIKGHEAVMQEAYEELRVIQDSAERWEAHSPDESLMDKLRRKN